MTTTCSAPTHGDAWAYTKGCTCPESRTAWAAYMRQWRAQRRADATDDPPDEFAIELALYGRIAANQLRADERRLAVTELIAAGYSTREIAHQMRYPFAEARRDRHVLNARRRRAQQARTDQENPR